MEKPRKEPGHVEQFLQDLFGPDLMLPEQFYAHRGASSTLTGERSLMWAVFTDGIECFRRTALSASARDLEEYEETRDWVTATDWESVFSFVNLCEQFGFEPTSIRKVLLDWEDHGSASTRRQRFRPVTLRAA